MKFAILALLNSPFIVLTVLLIWAKATGSHEFSGWWIVLSLLLVAASTPVTEYKKL